MRTKEETEYRFKRIETLHKHNLFLIKKNADLEGEIKLLRLENYKLKQDVKSPATYRA